MLRAMGLSLLLTELIELSAALLLKKREDIGLIALANLMTNPAVVYLSLLTKALRPGLYPAAAAVTELYRAGALSKAEAERALCRMGGDGVSRYAEVLSFSRLANRVFQAAGGLGEQELDGGGRLLLTASPNHPRIHLTNEPAENPAQPPMFCMLLRKHLTGGRLVSMQQLRWSACSTSLSTAPTRWAAPRAST